MNSDHANRFFTRSFTAVLALLFAFAGLGADAVSEAGSDRSDSGNVRNNSDYLVFTDASGVILEGHDTVAFFTEGEARKGTSEYAVTYRGATYYFVSADNQAAFSENPEKYKPQFGGHCAMSMAMGMVEPTQIDTWSIVDGRLVLQRNAKAVKMWSKDPQGNLKKADKNWPEVLEEKGKKG